MHQPQIKPHIRTKDDYLDRLDREAQYERECAREAALAIERREEDAYIARALASLSAGETEEEFEIREEAMQLARQRGVDFANAEISRIFAAAASTERRAA